MVSCTYGEVENDKAKNSCEEDQCSHAPEGRHLENPPPNRKDDDAMDWKLPDVIVRQVQGTGL